MGLCSWEYQVLAASQYLAGQKQIFFLSWGAIFLIWDLLAFSKYRVLSWRQSLEALGNSVPVEGTHPFHIQTYPPGQPEAPNLCKQAKDAHKETWINKLLCCLLFLCVTQLPIVAPIHSSISKLTQSLGSSVSFKKISLIPLSPQGPDFHFSSQAILPISLVPFFPQGKSRPSCRTTVKLRNSFL